MQVISYNPDFFASSTFPISGNLGDFYTLFPPGQQECNIAGSFLSTTSNSRFHDYFVAYNNGTQYQNFDYIRSLTPSLDLGVGTYWSMICPYISWTSGNYQIVRYIPQPSPSVLIPYQSSLYYSVENQSFNYASVGSALSGRIVDFGSGLLIILAFAVALFTALLVLKRSKRYVEDFSGESGLKDGPPMGKDIMSRVMRDDASTYPNDLRM